MKFIDILPQSHQIQENHDKKVRNSNEKCNAIVNDLFLSIRRNKYIDHVFQYLDNAKTEADRIDFLNNEIRKLNIEIRKATLKSYDDEITYFNWLINKVIEPLRQEIDRYDILNKNEIEVAAVSLSDSIAEQEIGSDQPEQVEEKITVFENNIECQIDQSTVEAEVVEPIIELRNHPHQNIVEEDPRGLENPLTVETPIDTEQSIIESPVQQEPTIISNPFRPHRINWHPDITEEQARIVFGNLIGENKFQEDRVRVMQVLYNGADGILPWYGKAKTLGTYFFNLHYNRFIRAPHNATCLCISQKVQIIKNGTLEFISYEYLLKLFRPHNSQARTHRTDEDFIPVPLFRRHRQ